MTPFSPMRPSFTPTDVKNYSNNVLQNKIQCKMPSCPVCHTHSDFFKRHEARSRGFRIICNALVHVVESLVIRWKCPGCNKTFTQQPPFALPRKRYTSDTILDLSGCYVEDEALSYRKTVLEEGMEVFYASTGKENALDERSLAHSTPYRWITTLGGLKEILRRGQDVILQKNPASAICRDLAVLGISPEKYVKAAREGVLKRCRQLIHLEARFRATFQASIFPFFATVSGWR